MEIIKLTETSGEIFETIVRWNYEWWGRKLNKSEDAVRCYMAHSVNEEKLPQTFVALDSGETVGMYQLSMSDDLFGRPDIYPWLINVYVDEAHRGKQIGRFLMETVKENAKKAGIETLYLYTSHVGLYEKFGWEFIEFVDTFEKGAEKERLYRLEISCQNTTR